MFLSIYLSAVETAMLRGKRTWRQSCHVPSTRYNPSIYGLSFKLFPNIEIYTSLSPLSYTSLPGECVGAAVVPFLHGWRAVPLATGPAAGMRLVVQQLAPFQESFFLEAASPASRNSRDSDPYSMYYVNAI